MILRDKPKGCHVFCECHECWHWGDWNKANDEVQDRINEYVWKCLIRYIEMMVNLQWIWRSFPKIIFRVVWVSYRNLVIAAENGTELMPPRRVATLSSLPQCCVFDRYRRALFAFEWIRFARCWSLSAIDWKHFANFIQFAHHSSLWPTFCYWKPGHMKWWAHQNIKWLLFRNELNDFRLYRNLIFP